MVVTLDDVDDGNKLYSAGMSKAVLFGGGFIYVRVISARCNETDRTEREMNKNIYFFFCCIDHCVRIFIQFSRIFDICEEQ